MYLVHPERVDNHLAADFWLMAFNIALLVYLVRGMIDSWRRLRREISDQNKETKAE